MKLNIGAEGEKKRFGNAIYGFFIDFLILCEKKCKILGHLILCFWDETRDAGQMYAWSYSKLFIIHPTTLSLLRAQKQVQTLHLNELYSENKEPSGRFKLVANESEVFWQVTSY